MHSFAELYGKQASKSKISETDSANGIEKLSWIFSGAREISKSHHNFFCRLNDFMHKVSKLMCTDIPHTNSIKRKRQRFLILHTNPWFGILTKKNSLGNTSFPPTRIKTSSYLRQCNLDVLLEAREGMPLQQTSVLSTCRHALDKHST